ncbi:Major facilitator superfamily domain-containing protein 6-B, partial [Bienertia sinuspersici]
IKVMQRQYGGPWLIVLKGDRGYHNHELLVYNEGHRQVSGLGPEAKKLVRDMTEARAKSGPILVAVKEQFPNLNPNKRHIYNCKAKLREQKAEGQQNWQFARRSILNEIVSHPFIYRVVYFDRFQEACARIDWGDDGVEKNTTWRLCAVMCFAVTDDGLNPNISVIVLLWDAEPTLTRPTTELTIAHLGSYKHFIRLELDDDFPVPPMSPIWVQLRTDMLLVGNYVMKRGGDDGTL